jgi:alkyl sulfatase BDS1-like metallo-beta-lactamase superfamily hydrolase
MKEEAENNEKLKRYNYIGYTQDFPLDATKYKMQSDLLLKLAREATKKRDYYKAIRYLNIILIKEPHNQEAKFYKRQVMEVLDQMKKKRSKDLISF